MKNNHLIFEGCELVGKSYLISKIYDFLEKKYNKNKNILDGCHWINSDIGIFGGEKRSDRSGQGYMLYCKVEYKSTVDRDG